MKFSIITPTILRDSLVETCKSIDMQDYKDWEHIVMIDTSALRPDLTDKIRHPNRRTYRCESPHKNYGNTCRHNAYLKCRGDYIIYIDDDDVFLSGAFRKIVNEIKEKRPNAAVFPAIRYGEKFFNLPPASCMTVTGQYIHKPIINGKKVQWPRVATGNMNYLVDGKFIESIKKLTEFTPICVNEPLVLIKESNHGI